MINVETQIILDRYIPRWYQLPIVEALESGRYKKLLAVWPRRSGKDITALNIALRQMLMRVCTVIYVFPTFRQAKDSIWSAIDNDGRRILDYYIPEELISKKNESNMEITLINGSVLKFIGSSNYDTIRGSNPYGVILSEASTQNPKVYPTIRPILSANGGWVYIESTPFGKNHFYDLYQLAENSKDWFCYKLTLDDTQHIPMAEIDSLRASGEMSEEMIQQEFYCSFSDGVEGTIYGRVLNELRLNNQITSVPYESEFPVHTAWDLGYSDSTAIIFFQQIGKSIHLIDYYENNTMTTAEYVDVVKAKPYRYGKHFVPFDSNFRNKEGMSQRMIASQLGLVLTNARERQKDRWSMIEEVRAKLPTFWIDEGKCSKLLKALTNYRKEYSEKKADFERIPVHNWASHGADSVRVLVASLNQLRNTVTDEEIESAYNRMRYGRRRNTRGF